MAVLSDDMGGITAYAAAVNRGYTGTKEEFEQLMYSYTEVAERAEAAAGNAHESEENSIEAKDIAVSAKNEAVSARDAAQSARDASISAKNNSESARDAAISAKDDTLAAKDAVMSAKSSVDETSANFSDEVTAAISDVNAAGRNQKELAKTHAIDSEAWAVGQREGADVGVSDTTYHNNSKYYAEQSELAKDDSVSAKNAAESAKADAISAKNEAETAKGDAQDIVADINAKSEQIDQNAEDISDLQTAISTKAEVDGNYENLTAGTAEQLASTVFIEDNAPYHFRTSGGSADIGDREYDQIVGGTVCWNQLADIVSESGSHYLERWASTIELLSGNRAKITSTRQASNMGAPFLTGKEFLNTHKYLASVIIKEVSVEGTPVSIQFSIYDNWTSIGFNKYKTYNGLGEYSTMFSSTVDANASTARFMVYINCGTNEVQPGNYFTIVNPLFIDLTQMFGSTIADYIYSLEQAHAGDGVAWFRKYFPKDYYAYNSGELISVSGLSAHKMTGFNQWDEEWDIGDIDGITGAFKTGNYLKTKYHIPVLPNTTYYFNIPSAIYFHEYDNDKNVIMNGNYAYHSQSVSGTYTTGANTYFIAFRNNISNGSQIYNNDICINLHWDGERDGEYEPYEEHSYPLDSNVALRGLFKLDANNQLYADGDIYDADGTVTRKYGIVDLGTLTWAIKDHAIFGSYFYADVASLKINRVGNYPDKVFHSICSKYRASRRHSKAFIDKTYCFDGSVFEVTQMQIKDSAYADAVAFKAAMSGVMLVYELAESTTEQAQPFTNPQIVDDFGTEEYVINSIVSVGHVTKYTNNLRAKLEMAPNSPDGDGDYIVRQTNGLNEYVSLSSSEVIQNINEAISDNAEQIETKADITEFLKAFPTDTASGSVASFADGANVPVKSLIVNIDPVQSGSGDPSPDNVRPISGWSEVNVNACGVNIWDEQWEYGLISVSSGQNIIGSGIRSKNYSPCKPSTEYRFIFSTGTTKYVFWYDADHNYIYNKAANDAIVRFTSPPNAKYFKLRADTINTYNNDFSVNYPSTDTVYHPYDGQSINIDLGQTVYGGTLDVVSGELVIDRAGVDLGTLNWTKNTSFPNLFSCFKQLDMKIYNNTVVADWLSSNYKITSGNTLETTDKSIAMLNTNLIYVNDSAYTDATAEQFKTAMSGVMLVYPLATPLTISLTPHEVTALLGSNNVWADCGDNEVVYRADPTLYIQRLTEPDADMVADANITSGQYFMVGNTLYKATANIASGATISPNVNCTRKSLSEALNELNV